MFMLHYRIDHVMFPNFSFCGTLFLSTSLVNKHIQNLNLKPIHGHIDCSGRVLPARTVSYNGEFYVGVNVYLLDMILMMFSAC
jgi:hypothetical protein